MSSTIVQISLIIPGIIHILPIYGIFGPHQLSTLYGMKFKDPNVIILMRHRAVLFGLLGGFMIYAAFKTNYRNLAFTSGIMSTSSFLLFTLSADSTNSKIKGVLAADVIALFFLLAGSAVYCSWKMLCWLYAFLFWKYCFLIGYEHVENKPPGRWRPRSKESPS